MYPRSVNDVFVGIQSLTFEVASFQPFLSYRNNLEMEELLGTVPLIGMVSYLPAAKWQCFLARVDYSAASRHHSITERNEPGRPSFCAALNGIFPQYRMRGRSQDF